MSRRQRDIIGFLADHGPASVHTVAERFGWSRQGARYHLEALAGLGVAHCSLGLVYLYSADPDGLRRLAWWLTAQADRASRHPQAL